MKQIIHNIIISAISLTTALGLFFHGVHIDQAAVTFHYRVTTAAGIDPAQHNIATPKPVTPDLHAHVDHNPANALLQFTQFSDAGTVNALAPRNEHRRHCLQNIVPRGRHPFDNTLLPMIS